MSNPHISINKLGEYLVANATRRKSIIKAQKTPSNFIVTRYREARESIIDFIIDNYNSSKISDTVKHLNRKNCTTEFEINDNKTSLEALSSVVGIQFPNLSNLSLTKPPSHEKLLINGVEVSVTPDIIIRGDKKGTPFVGAIKLHISKNNQLNEDARKYVATTLCQYVEQYLLKDGEVVSPEHCFSIDIFAKKCEASPKAFAQRRSQISSACEEIGLWWSAL